MNLLRRNLPCKIERKTERRTRESFLFAIRGKSNPTMVPSCEQATWLGEGEPPIAKLIRIYYKEE